MENFAVFNFRIFYIVTLLYVDRVDWMMVYQGMICLAGNQVWWTWECEDTFNKMKRGKNKSGMKDFAKKQHRQIDELVVRVRKHHFFYGQMCVHQQSQITLFKPYQTSNVSFPRDQNRVKIKDVLITQKNS